MHALLSIEQFDTYLKPLSESAPAGEYLKSNKARYRPLRNAYNIAQTSLQKLSLNPDPAELDDLISVNKENWLQLQTMLLDVLTSSSRDLESMVWLAMAQLVTDHPYEQLAIAIQLIDQSLQTYGETIQPFLPEDKLRSQDEQSIARERAELQCRPFKLLFGESEDSCQMAIPLRMLPLINDISFVRYQRDETNRDALRQEVRSVFALVEEDVISTIHAIQDVLDSLNALDQTLLNHFQASGFTVPASRFLRQPLEGNILALKDLTDGLLTPWPLDIQEPKTEEQAAPDLSGHESLSEPDVEPALAADEQPLKATSAKETTLFNRDQAFHQLRLLSDFFQRTEPQSPVSYLLEKAIRWGYTPLPDLMDELLQGNTNSLSYISELTGMNRTEKTAIPGSPVVSLQAVPTIAKPSPELTAEVKPLPEQPPESEPEIVDNSPVFPEQNQSEASTSSPEPPPFAPGGLAISNLDDLF